jgi:hypothetical protein
VSAFAVPTAQHAVAQLAGSEMTKNEAARRLDVEHFATEEIDVRRAIVGKHVAARVALGEKDDSGDGERAFEPVLADGGRADRRQANLRRELDKCFTNPVAIEPRWIASERVGNPMKSQHVGPGFIRWAQIGELHGKSPFEDSSKCGQM